VVLDGEAEQEGKEKRARCKEGTRSAFSTFNSAPFWMKEVGSTCSRQGEGQGVEEEGRGQKGRTVELDGSWREGKGGLKRETCLEIAESDPDLFSSIKTVMGNLFLLLKDTWSA